MPRTTMPAVIRRYSRAVAVGMAALLFSAACTTGQSDETGSEPTPAPSESGGTEPEPVESTAPQTATDPDEGGSDNGFPSDWNPAPLEWSTCHIGRVADAECATLVVPLDWADPDGEEIDLALARLPAGDDRLGSLLSNPGGPGGSGIDFLGKAPFSTDLADRFDLVSWDPRGVGASTAVTCGDAVGEFLSEDSSPDDGSEQASIEKAANAVSQECARADGDLLAHLHTEEVARDLEAIRLALGDEPLNYLGFSYGTHIGQLYAELFGTKIRSMVLDGVVDPSLDFEEFLLGQTEAFDSAFESNAVACASAGPRSCGVDDLGAAYDDVSAAVERESLPGGPNGVGPAELATAATLSAYRGDGWSQLGPALADALDGDGEMLWQLAANYYDFGSYGAYAAVVCTDSARPTDVTSYRDFYDRALALSPRFGPAVANEMLPCATWAVDPQADASALTAPEAPDILVIGNTGDPATPLDNAEAVADSLQKGSLVVVDIDGHTAYGDNRCATELVEDYLVNLEIPPPGATC